jgi:hypothetical protein
VYACVCVWWQWGPLLPLLWSLTAMSRKLAQLWSDSTMCGSCKKSKKKVKPLLILMCPCKKKLLLIMLYHCELLAAHSAEKRHIFPCSPFLVFSQKGSCLIWKHTIQHRRSTNYLQTCASFCA